MPRKKKQPDAVFVQCRNCGAMTGRSELRYDDGKPICKDCHSTLPKSRKKKQEEPHVYCHKCGAKVMQADALKNSLGLPLCEDCYQRRNIPAPEYNPKDVAFYPEINDEFFAQVDQIVNFDRQADYGDGLKRMEVAGEINNLLLTLAPTDMTPAQQHLLSMMCEKITRFACNPDKKDTNLDIAGYARFGYHAAHQ